MAAVRANELDVSATIIDSKIVVTQEKARKDMANTRLLLVLGENSFAAPAQLSNSRCRRLFSRLNIVTE